jgi:hypothetical protein
MGGDPLGQTFPGRNTESGWKYHRVRKLNTKLRIVGTVGLIIGQCLLLFSSREIGLVVLLASSSLSVPFYYREKMWDVLTLISFSSLVNLLGLIFR